MVRLQRSAMSSAAASAPQPTPTHVLLLLLPLLLLLLLELPSVAGIAGPLGVGEDTPAAARKVRLFIDLEKVNFYRGLIRRLVKLDSEVSCLRPGSMSLSCPDRSQIFINSVALRRSSLGDCAASGSGANDSDSLPASLLALSRCGYSRALQVVKLLCEERQQCSLLGNQAASAAAASANQDPYDLGRCEQLLPHLSVRFTCEPAVRSRFLCADTYSTISCDNRQKLLVLDALLTDKYLFQDGRCPNTANPSQGARHCPETNVFDEVKSQCDSRQECTLGALHSVPPGCARPNLLLLYACVSKKGYDQTKRLDLPGDRTRIPTVVYGAEPDGPAPPKAATTMATSRSGDERVEGTGGQAPARPAEDLSASRADAAAEDSQLASLLPQLSGRQAAVLGASAGLAALLAGATAVGCLLTRRWLSGRRRRAEEHLARVRLGKQIPPPATCLVIPPAETLLKLPAPHGPNGGGGCGGGGGGSGAHTVSVCLSQLGSPPRCGSIDGSGSGSGSGSGACGSSDRQSTSTSTFLMGGSAASRAGSLPSPRESLATYSMQQHQCATSVLEESLGPQQLGMI